MYAIKIEDKLEGLIFLANFSDFYSKEVEDLEPIGFFSEILKNAILREVAKDELRKSEEEFPDLPKSIS